MSPDEAIEALDAGGVLLQATSKEDRTYHLFFVPNAAKFIVAVVAQDHSTAITFLEKSQYESDRGMLRADDLRVAARKSLDQEAFDRWAASYNWADQRHDRKDLQIRARYRLADSCDQDVHIPLSFPLPNEVLAGGNLAKVIQFDGFLARANVDIYAALGDTAPQAFSNLIALDIVYGPHRVLDLLAIGGTQLLSNLRNRRLSRNSLSMVVTFEHHGRPFQLQKSRPPVPPAFMFQEMLPHLRTNHEFLTFVRDHIAKQVEPHEVLSAVSSITELQIGPAGNYVDLIKPPDDFEAVTIMLELP